jgi:hypothetical protein
VRWLIQKKTLIAQELIHGARTEITATLMNQTGETYQPQFMSPGAYQVINFS